MRESRVTTRVLRQNRISTKCSLRYILILKLSSRFLKHCCCQELFKRTTETDAHDLCRLWLKIVCFRLFLWVSLSLLCKSSSLFSFISCDEDVVLFGIIDCLLLSFIYCLFLAMDLLSWLSSLAIDVFNGASRTTEGVFHLQFCYHRWCTTRLPFPVSVILHRLPLGVKTARLQPQVLRHLFFELKNGYYYWPPAFKVLF